MSIRIAISGRMGSGKTTLAKALAEHYYHLDIDSFAAPLKQGCALMGVTDRAAHQDIATYLTDRDDEHFVKMLQKRNPYLHEFGLVIDDVRRRCEYDWCKRNGFYLVRLEAPRDIRIERGADPDRIDHHTENQLSSILPFDRLFYTHYVSLETMLRIITKDLEKRWSYAKNSGSTDMLSTVRTPTT